MTRPAALGLWALATVALAAATSFLVLRWHAPADAAPPDFHHWMHEQLELTAAQHDALAPAEQRFEESRRKLEARIANAGRALATAIRHEKPGSPEIDAALQQLHAAQAELQRATLHHFFEMKEQLDPEQSEKLLEWTHDRLIHP